MRPPPVRHPLPPVRRSTAVRTPAAAVQSAASVQIAPAVQHATLGTRGEWATVRGAPVQVGLV